MKSNFVYYLVTLLIVLHLLGIFISIFYLLVGKNPVYRDSNSRPNVSAGYEVTSELPRRPVLLIVIVILAMIIVIVEVIVIVIVEVIVTLIVIVIVIVELGRKARERG